MFKNMTQGTIPIPKVVHLGFPESTELKIT